MIHHSFRDAGEYVDNVRQHGKREQINEAVNWYRNVHGERAMRVARLCYLVGKYDIADRFMSRMILDWNTESEPERAIELYEEIFGKVSK